MRWAQPWPLRFSPRGVKVIWASDGGSEQSRRRAEAARVEDAGSLEAATQLGDDGQKVGLQREPPPGRELLGR